MLTTSTYCITFRIKKKHIHVSLIFLIFIYIFRSINTQCLYYFYILVNVWIHSLHQIIYHHHALITMQLHVIKVVVIYASNNALWHLVNKHAYTLWLILCSNDSLSARKVIISLCTIIRQRAYFAGNHTNIST